MNMFLKNIFLDVILKVLKTLNHNCQAGGAHLNCPLLCPSGHQGAVSG